MFAFTIHPDGSQQHVDFPDGVTPDLEFLQGAVGGFIEIVPMLASVEYRGETQKCVAFCDEEGKLKGKSFNGAATALWQGAFETPPFDFLVGDVLFICGTEEELDQL